MSGAHRDLRQRILRAGVHELSRRLRAVTELRCLSAWASSTFHLEAGAAQLREPSEPIQRQPVSASSEASMIPPSAMTGRPIRVVVGALLGLQALLLVYG